jgi:hypothetical protein
VGLTCCKPFLPEVTFVHANQHKNGSVLASVVLQINEIEVGYSFIAAFCHLSLTVKKQNADSIERSFLGCPRDLMMLIFLKIIVI